jgi:hypothetical protein
LGGAGFGYGHRVTRGRLLIVACVVILAAAYLVFTKTYRLEHGDTWSVGQGAVIEGGVGSDQQVAVHVLRPSHTVEIAITVGNPGALPVSFSGAHFEGNDVETTLVRMIERAGEGPGCCRPGDAVNFHPISIPRGKQVMLWITLRVTGANPYPPCSGFTLQEITVEYVVLGMPREQRIALRIPLSFRAPC